MKKGIFLTIVFLVLMQGLFAGWKGSSLMGPPEAAASLALDVKTMHPLPEWNGPEDLRARSDRAENESQRNRLKLSFPVGLLATLFFFLMWKFLQGQE